VSLIATRHEAELDSEVEVGFACPACGAAGRAVVHAEGLGSAMSIVGIGEETARRAALEEAHADAKREAKTTIALARCPSCSGRSLAARVRFVLPVLIVMFLLLAVAVACVFVFSGWLAAVTSMLLAFTAIGFAGRQFRRLTDTERFIRRIDIFTPAIPRATALLKSAPPVEVVSPGDDPRLLR
jgi:hypothetical protein